MHFAGQRVTASGIGTQFLPLLSEGKFGSDVSRVKGLAETEAEEDLQSIPRICTRDSTVIDVVHL